MLLVSVICGGADVVFPSAVTPDKDQQGAADVVTMWTEQGLVGSPWREIGLDKYLKCCPAMFTSVIFRFSLASHSVTF